MRRRFFPVNTPETSADCGHNPLYIMRVNGYGSRVVGFTLTTHALPTGARRWRTIAGAAACAALLLPAAAATVQGPRARPASTPKAATPAARPAPAPGGDKAYALFATNIESAVNAGDPTLFDGRIDWDSLVARATQGLQLPADFIRGMKSGVSDGQGFGATVVEQTIKKGGSYKLLRIRSLAGKTRALFRLLDALGEGGVNYHDLELTRKPNGEVRIADIYIYAAGENFSDILRRQVLPAAAQQNRGILAILTGRESDYLKNVEQLLRMQKLARDGKFREALALCEALPPSLKNDKNVLLQKVGIALKTGEPEYQAALREIEQKLPNDPCLDLLMLDALVARKKHAEAIQLVDKIDRRLGGDPYLEVIRAIAYAEAENPAQSQAALERAVAAEPTLIHARLMLIASALSRKDYARVALELTTIECDLGVEIADIEQEAIYEDFVKSEEYRKWKAARAKQAPRQP